MKLLSIVTFAGALALAAAKQIEGVFTSFDSIQLSAIPEVQFPTPATPSHLLHFSWEMNSTFASPGDKFVLRMTCVYSVTLGKDTFELIAEGKTYAICSITNAELSDRISLLDCTVTDEINNGDVVEGRAFIPVTFNIGGRASPFDEECALRIIPGSVPVDSLAFGTGNHSISTATNFIGVPESGNDASDVSSIVRYVPSTDNFDGYAVGPSRCLVGSTFNEFTLMVPGANIDCDSVKVHVTDAFNIWGLPAIHYEEEIYSECSSERIYVRTEATLGKGVTPFVEYKFTKPGTDIIQTSLVAHTVGSRA
ncbi:uncharacterized protein CANTADRAFT_99419 [Suhomyces tanzawaensis NRRL Y-17324]|uniref:Agglutinin-like protein N-terminal domain-containing protein n=1 Tax=Suhomyces tanzawaensis NRRL Y-17324 TaxID=984487 RepID=A0A1E4SNH9_9ASCO|nr:uncharacterized protein CANTADRAFT_99419 [Suhomyces tanzawaensis NRRL Y-17324]ODV81080.1 hypothetical protein CANTADRAFT_99419 [Suhomyces tanzawaensis NRRL Y-17324]